MIPLRRAVQKHTRGTTQIASPSQAIPLIGLQQALSTDAADAGGFYSLSFSSLRLGSDSRTPAPWLAPSAISLGVQLAFDPLRLSLSFNLLESYHSFLKLSTKKCAAQRKMSSPDERPKNTSLRTSAHTGVAIPRIFRAVSLVLPSIHGIATGGFAPLAMTW